MAPLIASFGEVGRRGTALLYRHLELQRGGERGLCRRVHDALRQTDRQHAARDRSLLDELFKEEAVQCPRCNSWHTELISQFASTACKSMYRCLDCKEAFDHFKCH